MANRAAVVLGYLRGREPVYKQLLERMVEARSYTRDPRGIARQAQLTADAFRNVLSLGSHTETIASDAAFDHGPHLICSNANEVVGHPLEGGGDGGHGFVQRVGLVSHLDTVYLDSELDRHAFGWRDDADDTGNV